MTANASSGSRNFLVHHLHPACPRLMFPNEGFTVFLQIRQIDFQGLSLF